MQGLTTAGSIVVIEDDADDLLLFELALKGSPLAKRVVFITEIQEFDNFLNQLAKSPDPLPALILINPFMGGVEIEKVLEILRGNQDLNSIPLALMLSSPMEIVYMQLGGNVRSIVKPIASHQIEELLL